MLNSNLNGYYMTCSVIPIHTRSRKHNFNHITTYNDSVPIDTTVMLNVCIHTAWTDVCLACKKITITSMGTSAHNTQVILKQGCPYYGRGQTPAKACSLSMTRVLT